ncbi:phosphotransferase family protein [Actinomadura alba]|uniref:Aminoglycoside phosphotransferase n=1 Tax=Actinomadura alba TaxID=406431 RepID=A0ABR7LMA5_9ACTN|nr:aminoglycoside phosphotransferase [Actinomadura alba]MBC6465909.1 aminoglycoside phosphotransferase [Actinomadura alba]
MRSDWTDLPPEVLGAIKAHTGPIHQVEHAPAGNHADIAATVNAVGGRVFVKAARKASPDRDGPEVRSLRNEARINPHVCEFAPRLLWEAETGGWLALGFEHVHGRHADYSPGSPDLELLVKVIDGLQAMPCPDVVGMRVERRWASVADDVSPMAGDALLHTDVNATNLIITEDGRAYGVDWAFASRGAAWVELGLLIPWLLKAGHTPAEAARWVAQFPSWASADPAAVELFSDAFAERWARHAAGNGEGWVAEHAELTRRWADYRRSLR